MGDETEAAVCGATIVRAYGRRLCKTVTPAAVVGYDLARTVDLIPVELRDLDGLAEMLRRLTGRTDAAIVRGQPIAEGGACGVRRLLHPDPETGATPTLTEVPRRWVALDVDGVPLPDGTDPCDLAACASAVLPLLPDEFHGVVCIVQATASHGVKPGARLRLWFWLDRPTSGAECKRWLRKAPVDHSVFGAAQVTYTATPVFAGGAVDPLPHRLLCLAGRPMVAVPPPEEQALRSRRQAALSAACGATDRQAAWKGSGVPQGPVSGRYIVAALAHAAARITAAPEGERHATSLREAWSLARLLGTGMEPEDLQRLIAAAIERAGKPAAEGRAVASWAVSRRMVERYTP